MQDYMTYFNNVDSDNARPAVVDTIADGTGDPKEGTLTFTTTPNNVADASIFGRFCFSHSLTGSNSTVKTIKDVPGTDAKENEIAGTFVGVPGTFVCTSECTVTGDAKGSLTAIGGPWAFSPSGNASNIVVEDVIKDVDYLVLWILD